MIHQISSKKILLTTLLLIITMASTTAHKVLVIGSTGATGKHVVRMLLDQGDTHVVAVSRSKDKLMGLINRKEGDANLSVKETSISGMTPEELKELTKECTAVVSCLGHNLTFKGIWKDGLFIQETVKKVCNAMPQGSRFILMGTDAVANPDGSDPERTRFERGLLKFLRWLLPPAVDNEMSAMHLYQDTKSNPSFCDWAIVRPGDLINKDENDVYPEDGKPKFDYNIYDTTWGGLFGDNSVARSDVAHFMTKLATMETKEFKHTYNHKMPVIYQKKKSESTETKK